MPKNYLHCLFRSFVTLNKYEIIQVVKFLEEKNFTPIKYGQSSTRPKFEYNAFSKDDIAEKCYETGGVAIKGEKFVIEMHLGESCAKPFLHVFSLMLSKKTDMELVTTIVKDLFGLLRACYAFAEFNYNGDSHTSGRNIEDCLGGFSWLNIFGKPYIDLWGKETIMNAPAYKIENLGDCVSIMLSENPFYTTASGKAKSMELKKYFGLDYFYKYDLEHSRTTFKSIQEIMEYDTEKTKNIHYLAPDFHKYYDYESNSNYMFLVQKKVLEELD